jgi:1,4-dihydroxy-2-naphthoate octaprenyltransferase
MNNLRTFIKFAQPLRLFWGVLTFILGAGMARYLGRPPLFAPSGLILIALVAIQVSSSWLVEYFRLPFMPLMAEESPKDRERLRAGLFQFSMALLTFSGACVVVLFVGRLISLQAWVLFAIIVLLFVCHAIPPIRLADAGYGELVTAVILGTLYPALAFFIQFGEFHRLLTFITFPLTLLALANLLVNNFPSYLSDLKLGHHSLLTRLTWQAAIPIHHLLLLIAFLSFAASPLLGLPWRLVWPVFLVLPFALAQIFWLQRIARGGRTEWRFLIPLSSAVFGLTVYVLTLSFWIR